ncbi:unnamed protein product [Peronospora belbahrii]|uniref:SCP domain-containing protein n=1 Tax=Peronospora belbahrii TaxID=622444 RepID=A0AAU9L247_9STRA|nr:unnamed protein product [Peronospora belbahrii]CAH0522334.1 unnamed protein product [Peronospora belbahrii]
MTTIQSSLVLLLAILVVSLDIVMAVSNLRTTQRKLQTYAQYSDYRQEMLDAVNIERVKAGLSALCTNSKLADAAMGHSEDMAVNDHMTHAGSDGSTLSQRVTATGYEWDAIAENVAVGQKNVVSVVESWMNSDGHRANILASEYTMLGAAYVYRGDTTNKHYWTQVFGTGETETCDSGNSAVSQMTDQKAQQQTQDFVAAEASTTPYTIAQPNTDPATTVIPATTTHPALEALAATTSPSTVKHPVITEFSTTTEALKTFETPVVDFPATVKTTKCKSKK